MPRSSSANPFGPGLIGFLRDVERNNDREWFAANKERYEADVREPALVFIRAMAPHVARISPHLLADDRRVGGSLMRIHRDIRFSLDKKPFKTNLGIQFRHEAGKDIHAPGLYFHVEPKSCFLGVGMWHPDKTALAAVRRAIVDDPRSWKRVRDGKRFREVWDLRGESLKRPPRGFPVDHPMDEDLRRKDHIAIFEFRSREVTRPDLIDWVAARYRSASGYLDWLASAVGLPL